MIVKETLFWIKSPIVTVLLELNSTILLPLEPMLRDSPSIFKLTLFLTLSFITEPSAPVSRSEEHTSELQSRPHLVCRLLLEKKKGDAYLDGDIDIDGH